MRKKEAAYQVRRSAVKKVQLAKRGIASPRHINPAMARIFEFLLYVSANKIKINNISCGFIFVL